MAHNHKHEQQEDHCCCEHEEHEAHCCCGHEEHEHKHEHEEHCGCGHEHTHEHEEHCGCGCGCHDHDDGLSCGCGCEHDHEKDELPQILIGAGLFVLGVIAGFLPFLPGWAGIPLYVASYLILGGEVLLHAGKNLIRGKMLDENFLMSIATLGAFAIGEYPEAVGVMLFFRIGEYFEDKAVERSRAQVMAAADMRPDTVLLETGETVRAEDVTVGTLVTVRPGDRIPLDGVVVAGESRVDTAPVTGEPVPVRVVAGDSVTSGCVNVSGVLTVRVEKPLSESMVTRILQAVESAAASKPKIDRFITRFARIYTPVIVVSAILTAVVPSLITHNWNYWVYTALSFLVMSCPCALVLSVPLAFYVGIGSGSKKGILYKGGLSMEQMAGVKAVAMDKTGTMTAGNFAVQEVTGDVLPLACACEASSSHPIAVSILAAGKEQGITVPAAASVQEIAGEGIVAEIEGKTVLCGNKKLLTRYGVECPTAKDTGSAVYVAQDGQYLGHILVSDTLKPGGKEAVNRLHKMGIQTALLTGDRQESAQAVSEKLGVRQVFASLLPEEKLTTLRTLREKFGPVMFVGDGINDAPVLSGADVGAAIGSGTDAAVEAADVVLLHGNPEDIPEALALARRTRTISRQNVIFALAIKAAVILLGLIGFANMWLAVFADTGVAMLCILNSIRGK